MKKLLFIALLWSINAQGQYQTAHWFFGGHAGLDFTNGAPVVETGGMIDTEEGMASISNDCGELQFYTDGITVRNVNHLMMPNGTGLKGDPSSTQSAIIIPNPSQANIYYIFTVDDGFSSPSPDGIAYSVVDMNLGYNLGNIIAGQKNVNLIDHAGEKITAVAASDGMSYWVVTLAPQTTNTQAPYNAIGQNFNTFYAFKVDAGGVNPVAVVSTLSLNISGGAGYMKLSPDGSHLAIANMNDPSLYLLDFDNTTGVVSNPIQLDMLPNANEPYGVEFSPDSSKLYVSNWNDRLFQYDLNNNNDRTVIDARQNYRSALQLGMDGKIYQTHTTGYGSGTNHLSVIDNPNEIGTACNYQYRAINMGTGLTCHQGLPNFAASYFNRPVAAAIVHNAQFTQYEITANESINSIDWDFGDGTTLTTYPDNAPDNTHTLAQHTYTTNGIYTITAVLHYASGCDIQISSEIDTTPGSIYDTKWQQVHIYPNPSKEFVNIYLGEIDRATIEIYDLSGKKILSKVQNGQDNIKINTIKLSGIYFVKVSNADVQKVFKLIVKQ